MVGVSSVAMELATCRATADKMGGQKAENANYSRIFVKNRICWSQFPAVQMIPTKPESSLAE
jgi:hypothetical protein